MDEDHSLKKTKRQARDWYVQEWLLLLFAVGMLLFLFFVARHENRLQQSEIFRDAAVIEQSIARELEAQQSFFDRLALDLGSARLTAEQFDDIAGKRAIESGLIKDVLLCGRDMGVVRHTPATRPIETIALYRAPYAELMRVHSFAEKTGRGTYTDPYRTADGQWFIEYATPVMAGERFDGTIVLLISLDHMLEKTMGKEFGTSYRAILSNASGEGMSAVDPGAIGDSGQRHTIKLSVPWRDLRLTLYARAPSNLLANLTLTVAVLALTALMVWTAISLRTQQRMRREAEAERDRVFLQSLSSLRQANERFETVLDSIDVAVYVSDLETHEILFCNSRFRETFPGFAVGARSHPIEQDMIPNPTVNFPAGLLAPGGKASPAVYVDELEQLSTQRWFLMRTRAVDWVDGRVARLTTLGNITDRVLAERMRQAQQDKLTRTSRLMTLGEIASTLAHEINQPLGAIANYVNGCIRRLRMLGNVDEQVIRAMEKADAQVQRAGAIISRVREFVRTREPQRESLDLNELVRSAAKLMQTDEADRALRCRLDLDEQLPWVFADRIMIEQVLLNLLRNAREAMAHLPVSSREVTIRTRPYGNELAVVEVVDSGTGISSEAAAQLFSPFFTTKQEGMGMGLNICRSLIEYHQGSLTFENNPDVGTTFRFTLPFAQDTT